MPFYIVIDMAEHKISLQIELRQNKLDIRGASNGI